MNHKRESGPRNDAVYLFASIINIIRIRNEPNGSTFETIVSDLDAQNIFADDSEIRRALKSAVDSGHLIQMNRDKWKALLQPNTTVPPMSNQFYGIFGHDVILEILCHLTAKDLFPLQRVCKSWKSLLESKKLWRKLDFSDRKGIPTSAVNYALQKADGNVEEFILDENDLCYNTANINISSLLIPLFLSQKSLKRLELKGFPLTTTSTILQFSNLTTLSFNNPQEVSFLTTLCSLPLSSLAVCLFPSIQRARIVPPTIIHWPSTMKFLYITTKSGPFHFNIPKNLVKFSMVPNSSISHLRNDPTKIVNISDLFTKNLVWAHIDEIPLNYEILKLVSNATNLQVLKGILIANSNLQKVDLNLPKLVNLTLKELKDTKNLTIEFSDLSNLETLYVTEEHIADSIMKKTKGIKDLTVATMKEYACPNIESLRILNNPETMIWNNYKTLQVLDLKNIEMDQITIDLPVLRELSMVGIFIDIALNTPNLKHVTLFSEEPFTIAVNSAISLISLKTDVASLQCLTLLRPVELQFIGACIYDIDPVDVLADITSIAFLNCWMTHSDLVRFLSKHLKKIHIRNAIATESDPISDKSVYAIADVCTNIEEIKLVNCAVTGKSMQYLKSKCSCYFNERRVL